MRPSSRAAWPCAALIVLVSLSSCAAGHSGDAPVSTSTTSTTAATTRATAAPPTSKTKNWFDLAVGDCLSEIPAIDEGAVTVTVVDCATPHVAEVYLLSPLKVDTAIDRVAGEKCAEGFVDYTGQPFNGSAFRVSYLIDSNQDRTADNPTPSTAICYLQAVDGQPLAKSARR